MIITNPHPQKLELTLLTDELVKKSLGDFSTRELGVSAQKKPKHISSANHTFSECSGKGHKEQFAMPNVP